MATAHKNIQLLAFICLVVCFSLVLSTLIYDTGKHWRELGLTGEAVESVVKYDGLFIKCSFYPTGQEECGRLDPLNLPEFTTMSRVMMLMTCVLLIMALLSSFIGSAHTSCLYKSKSSDRSKARCVVFAGFCTAVCCILVIVTGACYSLVG